MTWEQLAWELRHGAKFVVYQYCVSILVLTFLRNSEIHFIPHNRSSANKGVGYTLLSLLAGWWGLPWGPIYTLTALTTNLSGGKDVTAAVVSELRRQGFPLPHDVG